MKIPSFFGSRLNRNEAAKFPPPQQRNIRQKTLAFMGALLLLTFMVVCCLKPVQLMDEPYWYMLHPALELFSITVSLLVFSTGWHFRPRHQEHSLLFIAATFLTVGLIDFAHIMTYNGISNVFVVNSQQTFAFSLVARFLIAIGLLMAALQLPKKSKFISPLAYLGIAERTKSPLLTRILTS